jgi:hypothetical protein
VLARVETAIPPLFLKHSTVTVASAASVKAASSGMDAELSVLPPTSVREGAPNGRSPSANEHWTLTKGTNVPAAMSA